MLHRHDRHTGLRRASLAATALLGVGLLLVATGAHAAFWFGNRPMPEFTNQSPSAWINSKPLTREELRGKVVLIEELTAG